MAKGKWMEVFFAREDLFYQKNLGKKKNKFEKLGGRCKLLKHTRVRAVKNLAS
jgi:hypothetical protein